MIISVLFPVSYSSGSCFWLVLIFPDEMGVFRWLLKKNQKRTKRYLRCRQYFPNFVSK